MKDKKFIFLNIFLSFCLIIIILLLSYIKSYSTNNQTKDSKEVYISDSVSDDSYDNSLRNEGKDDISDSANSHTYTEGSDINNITGEDDHLISPNHLTSHGKNIKIYGKLSTDDKRINELYKILSSYNKNISLIAYSTDGTRALSYNTEQTYFSACTIKAGFVLSCCKQIDEGFASKDTLLTYQKKHYHKGSGNIKKEAYGTKYSIENLLNLCLSISDNAAYKMLAEYFGYEEYNQMIDKLSATSLKLSSLWGHNVQLQDYIKVWDEVYKYFKSETDMSVVLKNSCTNTPFNYGTKTLENVDYSHKSGDNFGELAVYSDAGIVWSETPYIFAVFTNSEGTSKDIQTVNSSMELVHQIMTDSDIPNVP